MNQEHPAFGKGVRLRRESDGAMLLVPEGALALNATAAAALDLVDGRRSVGEIAALLAQEFDVLPERARAEVEALFARLTERRFVVMRSAGDDT